jgi:glycosyltransferase involved in cell wall biosynthesis
MKQRVIIVIPAYNEEKTISNVLMGLRRTVPECARVVVNDGSKDATGSIIEELGERQIKLPCNLGYGLALQTGFKYALSYGYEIIVCFDADGQHQPKDVPRVLKDLIENDADMVIGSRFCDGTPYTGPFGRRLGQHIFSRLTRLLIIGGTFLDFHIESLVRLSMFGFQVEESPVAMGERSFGESMHSFASFIDYPLKTLLLTIVAAIDAFIARRVK